MLADVRGGSFSTDAVQAAPHAFPQSPESRRIFANSASVAMCQSRRFAPQNSSKPFRRRTTVKLVIGRPLNVDPPIEYSPIFPRRTVRQRYDPGTSRFRPACCCVRPRRTRQPPSSRDMRLSIGFAGAREVEEGEIHEHPAARRIARSASAGDSTPVTWGMSEETESCRTRESPPRSPVCGPRLSRLLPSSPGCSLACSRRSGRESSRRKKLQRRSAATLAANRPDGSNPVSLRLSICFPVCCR